jgi:threonine dehydratase
VTADPLPLAEALDAVRSLVPPSPLLEVPELSERSGSRVLLKLESLQVTGSFKVRGAAARILALTPGERRRGVVTCSSGNHGRAVAWVAGRLGVPAVVCVPDWVDPVKLEAIRESGAEALLAGSTYDEAALRARELADERGFVFVHPFDDPRVAAGQGTVALEILDALPDAGTLVVPLSGGGLAGGMGAAAAERGRDVRVVAASAERARVMYESLRHGAPLELPEEETVANALSGGIELENRCTFGLVRRHVTDHVVVAEEAIERAMAWAFRRGRLVVEGGGAVALAALIEGAVAPADDRPLVVVVSGGNVAADVLLGVLGRR